MEKEYLFHGSPVKVDKLIPSQACDVEVSVKDNLIENLYVLPTE